MLSSYNTVKPCQKCLIHPTGFGVKWAVRGTNFCNSHGGQLPEITKAAEQAVQGARDRLVLQAEIQYDGDMTKQSAQQPDTVSRKLIIEQIETDIEEWRESSIHSVEFDNGIIQGLELALRIVKDA